MTVLRLTRPLVVFDTETTGEHPDADRIIQVGIVKLYPDGRTNEWETLVNPGVPIPPEITEVHGIDDDDVRGAPSFSDIAGLLYKGFHECDVCGYNVDFDLRFMKAEFRRARTQAPVWLSAIDPGRIFHLLQSRRLTDAVSEYVGKEEAESFEELAHDALEDTRMTLRVLEAQLQREEWLPREPEALAAWTREKNLRGNRYDEAGKLAWRHGRLVINFGQKELLVPVEEASRGYLEWMLRGDFSDEVKAVLRDVLAGRPAPLRAPRAAQGAAPAQIPGAPPPGEPGTPGRAQ